MSQRRSDTLFEADSKFRKERGMAKPIKAAVITISCVLIFGALFCVLFFHTKTNADDSVSHNTTYTSKRTSVQTVITQAEKTDNEQGSETTPIGGSVKYLAIGNSVTQHEPVGELWWGLWGMAATTEDKDYVHCLKSHMESSGISVDLSVCRLTTWEFSQTRDAELGFFDPYINSDLDLITMQLGENIVNTSTFEHDLCNLIEYIKAKAPNATLVIFGNIIGDWGANDVDTIKRNVAAQKGIHFVDMSQVANKPEYQQVVGGVVTGADGGQHSIVDPAVARHPNDDGMQKIADIAFATIENILS